MIINEWFYPGLTLVLSSIILLLILRLVRFRKKYVSKSLEIKALYKMNRNLIDNMDLDDLLQNLVNISVDLINSAQSSSIFLLNEDKTLLEGKVSYLIPPHQIKKLKFKVGEAISGKAVVTGESMIFNRMEQDFAKHNKFLSRNKKTQKSVVVVPLKAKRKLIGTISIDNYDKYDAFSKRDMRILESLAASASLAIERVRLFNEIEEQVHTIEITNKTLDERLKENEEFIKEIKMKNEELKAYDQMVSHDLKGPIGQVHSFAQLLNQNFRDALGEDGKMMTETILNRSKASLELIEGILAYASAEKHEAMEDKVDLNQILHEVVEGNAIKIEQSNAKIMLEELPSVEKGISVKIYQLFYNLVSNALKFQKEGSTPEIRVYQNDADELVVEDNGIGFDQSKAEQIFKPLMRLDKTYEGHGIGLGTCKRIIDLHGWKIRAESQPLVGTKFIITLQ